jgi:hypothetical protein
MTRTANFFVWPFASIVSIIPIFETLAGFERAGACDLPKACVRVGIARQFAGSRALVCHQPTLAKFA